MTAKRRLDTLAQLLLTASLSVGLAACGGNDDLVDDNGGGGGGGVTPTAAPGGNNPPVSSGSLAEIVFTQGGNAPSGINIASVFNDPDGDQLRFSVASNSNPNLLTVSFNNNFGTMDVVVLDAAGTGRADIVVAADDGRGGSATTRVGVIVRPQGSNNTAPVVANPISDQQFQSGASPAPIPLQNVFTDIDGDALTLSVTSRDTSVVQAILSADNSSIQLTLTGEGQAQVDVVAQDSTGASVTDTFNVAVVRVQAGQVTGINPANFDLPPCSAGTAASSCFAAKPINLPDQFVTASGNTSGLIFFVTSDNTNVATVTQNAARQAIVRAVPGTALGQVANISVTARDTDGATGTINFRVTISNVAPQFACTPGVGPATGNTRPTFLRFSCPGVGVGGIVGDDTVLSLQERPNRPASSPVSKPSGLSCGTAGANSIFCDAPAPGLLSFEVLSSNPNVALASIDEQNDFRVLLQSQAGTATISIFATDADGNTVSTSFLVNNQITGQTVPLTFNGLPNIAVERTENIQVFRIQLADFVADANPQDSDADRDPRLNPGSTCSLENPGAPPAEVNFDLALNPNPSVATAVEPAGVNELGIFNINVQPVNGTTTLTFEVRDCEGDVSRTSMQVTVTEPDKELFVVRAPPGNGNNNARQVLRFANDATGSDDPLAIFDTDLPAGLAFDEAGSMYQVGRIFTNISGTINVDRRPSLRVMHNVKNRAPALNSLVTGAVGGATPTSTFNGVLDRQFFLGPNRAPANGEVKPLNVIFEPHSGFMIMVSQEQRSGTQISAPPARTAAFPAIQIFAPERGNTDLAGTAALEMGSVYTITTADLNDAANDGDAWDAVYAPTQDNLYVAMTNGTVVRCDAFVANVNASLPPNCKLSVGGPTRTLRPQVRCIDQNNSGSTVNCQRNLHGIDYVQATDTLVVTDVGPLVADPTVPTPQPDPAPNAANDGSVYVFHQVSLSDLNINQGFVVPDLTIRNRGDLAENPTLLGNPVDVFVDGTNIIVAEKLNTAGDAVAGGVLRFDGLAAIGAPVSGTVEVAPTTFLHVNSPETVLVSPVLPRIQDLSDHDGNDQLPGVIARRDETDAVLLSSSQVVGGATQGVIQRYAVSYDPVSGDPNTAPTQQGINPFVPGDLIYAGGLRVPQGSTTFNAASPLAGMDISVVSEIVGAVVGGPQANQPGGLVSFGSRTAVSPVDNIHGRIIQSASAAENTDLVNPKGLDLVQELGMVIVADFRNGNSTPAGAIQVFGFGAEGDRSPLFSTLLANRRPWDLDYDVDADRLYVAATDGSVLVFDNYIARFVAGAANRHLNGTQARVIVPAESGNRISVNLHGIVHHRATDADGNVTHEELILTDVGSAASSTDGQFMTMTLANPATATGLINVDLRVSTPQPGNTTCDSDPTTGPADPMTLGNPVDVAYDPIRDVAFVAEKLNNLLVQFRLNRAAAGNRVISFDLACRQVRDAGGTVLLSPEAVQIQPNYLP